MQEFVFFTYPQTSSFLEKGVVLLTPGAPELSVADAPYALLILDGTWRYAEKMMQNITFSPEIIHRSLPAHIRTAYPRKQTGCSHPDEGLASIEAIFAAHLVLGRKTEGILDQYYWKEEFLQKNPDMLPLGP